MFATCPRGICCWVSLPISMSFVKDENLWEMFTSSLFTILTKNVLLDRCSMSAPTLSAVIFVDGHLALWSLIYSGPFHHNLLTISAWGSDSRNSTCYLRVSIVLCLSRTVYGKLCSLRRPSILPLDFESTVGRSKNRPSNTVSAGPNCALSVERLWILMWLACWMVLTPFPPLSSSRRIRESGLRWWSNNWGDLGSLNSQVLAIVLRMCAIPDLARL